MEAAEQVCVGEGIGADEVLDLLTSLADKSLLVVDERDGATRYGLLETVRHYLLGKLRESGEESRTRGQHLAYFLTLAEDAEARLKGADQQMWLGRLEMEHDNVRAALAWSSGGGDVASGLRLAAAFFQFQRMQGYFAEGRNWIDELLAAAPSGQPSAVRAMALLTAGQIAQEQGDHSAAEALLGESLAILRELSDRRGIARALHSLGIVAWKRSDHSAARAFCEEALAIHRELGDRAGISVALNVLGVIAMDRGDYPVVQTLFEESLAIDREQGNRAHSVFPLNNLGMVAYYVGDFAAARAWHEECLAIGRELGARSTIAGSLNNLGMVASAEGDHAAARALCQEGLAIRSEQGDRWGMAWSLEGVAATYSLTVPVTAARIWGRAERLREEIGSPLPLPWRPRYEQQIAAARAALDDDTAFNLAWQEGQTMTLEQAVLYALEAEDAAPTR